MVSLGPDPAGASGSLLAVAPPPSPRHRLESATLLLQTERDSVQLTYEVLLGHYVNELTFSHFQEKSRLFLLCVCIRLCYPTNKGVARFVT